MEQELNFTVELTMNWAYRLLMQLVFFVFFFFTLPFLCHALNFMTAGSQLEYYLPSNSPLLSVQRIIGPILEFSRSQDPSFCVL